MMGYLYRWKCICGQWNEAEHAYCWGCAKPRFYRIDQRQARAVARELAKLDRFERELRELTAACDELEDVKAENERLWVILRRYYRKHHETVMTNPVRVASGLTDCFCTACTDVREMEARDEDPKA